MAEKTDVSEVYAQHLINCKFCYDQVMNASNAFEYNFNLLKPADKVSFMSLKTYQKKLTKCIKDIDSLVKSGIDVPKRKKIQEDVKVKKEEPKKEEPKKEEPKKEEPKKEEVKKEEHKKEDGKKKGK